MAWDKDRPYAPFWNRTDWKQGTYGCMDNYGDGETISEDNIDTMYSEGEYAPECYRWDPDTRRHVECMSNYVYRPFKDVRLKLQLKFFEQRRAAGIFWWSDENGKRYPMFAAEFNRLIDPLDPCSLADCFTNVIDGIWSAEKRGQNYGIRLESVCHED